MSLLAIDDLRMVVSVFFIPLEPSFNNLQMISADIPLSYIENEGKNEKEFKTHRFRQVFYIISYTKKQRFISAVFCSYSILNFFVRSRSSSAICARVVADELISSIEASCSSADAAMS